jgi:APA family basic amino acid/polyamine antiporter
MATKLRRSITTTMLALYGIGNIVGAGVYVLIGKIAEPAGYLAVGAFLLAAIIAFFAALSYAELAARFPFAAGISVYLHQAFNKPKLSTTMGILLIAAGTVSSATLLKGFAGYFSTLVPLPQPLLMTLAMALLLVIMLKGIKETVGAAVVLTLIEIGGLLFLIGSILFFQPDALGIFGTHFIEALQSVDALALTGVISATFIAFYAFIGFEDMVNIAEEVKQPQKAFPRAIIVSMIVVTLLYIAVATTALGVLTPEALGQSSAPLADAYSAAAGNSLGIIVIISLLATINGVIVNLVMGSRFLYGLGKRKWLPEWFAKVSTKSRVPARGLIIVSAAALVCAWWLPIENLAQLTSLLLLIVFFAVNLSLIAIRRRDSEEERKLRISPHFIPWAGVIASAALVIGQIFVLIHPIF